MSMPICSALLCGIPVGTQLNMQHNGQSVESGDSTDGGCIDDREPSDFISVYAVRMNDVPEPMGPVKLLNFRFLDEASV